MIGIRIWTRTQTVWMVAGALALGLSLPAGCGAGSGGGGTSTNDNDNQNQNDTDPGNSNQNTNTNGSSNINTNGNANDNENDNGNEAMLTAEIGGLPVGDLEVGQQIQLRADVINNTGDLTFEWLVDRDDLATLSATDIADPILTTLGEGLVGLLLSVHH